MSLSVGLCACKEVRNKAAPVDTFENMHFYMFLLGYTVGAFHPLEHSEPTLTLFVIMLNVASALHSIRAHSTRHNKYVDTTKKLHFKRSLCVTVCCCIERH